MEQVVNTVIDVGQKAIAAATNLFSGIFGGLLPKQEATLFKCVDTSAGQPDPVECFLSAQEQLMCKKSGGSFPIMAPTPQMKAIQTTGELCNLKGWRAEESTSFNPNPLIAWYAQHAPPAPVVDVSYDPASAQQVGATIGPTRSAKRGKRRY